MTGHVTPCDLAKPAIAPDGIALLPQFLPQAGDRICLRHACPRDRERVQAYFRALSTDARCSRFLGGMRRLPESVLTHFVREARTDQFTTLATTLNERDETVVGEARYVLDSDASEVELALSVNDTWQGRGVGRRLVQELERHAMASGVRRIFGETLESNDRIRHLAQGFGYLPGPGSDQGLIRFKKVLRA